MKKYPHSPQYLNRQIQDKGEKRGRGKWWEGGGGTNPLRKNGGVKG